MSFPFPSPHLILVLLLGLFQTQTLAFDQEKPEDISDKSWASLKTAVQDAKLLPVDGDAGDEFGNSVSLFGDRALIGASFDDDNGSYSGSVYVFEHNGGTWSEVAKLTASDGAASDGFGRSVSLFGNRALIGASGDDDNGGNSGSAYVFDLSGGIWSETVKLTASNGAELEYFGLSVSLFGDRALIGVPGDSGTFSGSAYVFDLSGGSWSETIKLTASDVALNAQFGYSVSLSGDRALVGAYQDNENGTDSGSAYVFNLINGSWSEAAKLIASDGKAFDNFGWSVSLSGDKALIGAVGDDDNGGYTGSAYVFDLSGGNWSETAKLIASDGSWNDFFGNSVSLFGDRALIGAYGDSDNGNESGSAYVFDLSGGNWSETVKLIASDGAYDDNFGRSVSLSNDRALIGALANDDNGSNSGSAYVFELLDDLIFSDGFDEP